MRRAGTSIVVVAFTLLGAGLLAACSDAAPEPSNDGSGGRAEAGAGANTEAGHAPSSRGGQANGLGGASEDADAGADGEPRGGEAQGGQAQGGQASEGPPDAPYAHEVVSFTAGEGAGFNADELPDIVLGPPRGLGTGAGSLDVLSLGAGGEIVLAFGNRGITNGAGADFVVFENPFWPNDDASAVFAELGEVSVSEDGETWHTFECDSAGDGEGNYPGCAGWSPTLEYDAEQLVPLDPELTGGDTFDLADVGLEHARFVRIRDLETQPAGGISSGFDLDAVGLIHAD